MARMQRVNKGLKIAVAVLEPVDVEKFSKALVLLIRQKTYIEWREDTATRDEFWMRLRKAVARPIWIPSCNESVRCRSF